MGTYVNQASVDSAGAATSQGANLALTAGNHLVICVLWEGNSTPSNPGSLSSVTVADNSDATILGSVLSINTSRAAKMQMAYLPEITTGGTKAITANLSAQADGRILVHALQFASFDTSAFYSAGTYNTNTSAGATATLTVTTATANEMVVAWSYTQTDDGGITGYTLVDGQDGYAGYLDAYYDLDVGAAAAQNLSTPGSSNWGFVGAGFKTAGSSTPIAALSMNHSMRLRRG